MQGQNVGHSEAGVFMRCRHKIADGKGEKGQRVVPTIVGPLTLAVYRTKMAWFQAAFIHTCDGNTLAALAKMTTARFELALRRTRSLVWRLRPLG